ncbi:hypothetical protein M8J77_005097 [Diaphorina citri]|nr:hypothetical protein M8J77_005097 [Diaphorina citri]
MFLVLGLKGEQSASAQAALQAAQALTGQTDTQGGPNTVLRVIIEHMLYPITLDVLYQIFSRYGKVMKIVTFTKNNSFQVLIQYPDVVTAQSAKLSLDGQNIYNSCCTLRIEYSKLSSLNVKYNNDKSRDYTNPSLPNGDTGMDTMGDQLMPQLMPGGIGRRNMGQNGGGAGLPLGGFGLGNGTSLGAGPIRLPGQLQGQTCVLLVSNLNEEECTGMYYV